MHKFLESYGEEESCRAKLFKARWPDGFICPRCRCTHYYSMSKVRSCTSYEINCWLEKHLHHESVVITDGFRPFSSVCEVVDLHHAINATGIYDDPNNKFFHLVNTMIGNVKRAIHGTYHSVSSKHLPRYLAEFSFRFNNRFQMGKMIDTLMQQAVCTNPLPRHKLKLAEDWGESDFFLSCIIPII